MATTLNITSIPAPRVSLIDERTGTISREWYRFLLNLFVLTGSGSNPTSLEDLQLGPPVQEIDLGPLDPTPSGFAAYAAGSAQESQIAEIQKQLEALASSTNVSEVLSELAEVWKQLQSLQLVPQGLVGIVSTNDGGTNTSATPTLGAVVYGTGTAQAYTPPGSSGQFLTSAGGAPPTWTSATALAGAIGYYGAFHDTSTVTATSTTTAYVMNLGSVDLQNGVSIVGGTKVTVANAGVYNFQFSAQLSNPNAAIANVSVWLRLNGVNVTDGAGTNGVPAKHGANDGLQIISWNYVLSLAAADYLELVWHSDTTGVQLITFPATTSPAVPESPSLIVTIGAQSQIGIGYYGQTSSTSTTIGTGSKTFTVGIPATTTAFTIGTRVRFAYTTTPSNFMEGVITAFATTSMTVLVDLTGGSGTYAAWSVSVAGNQGTGAVTAISVVSANGLAGTSSGGATPALTLSTSVTGILKGNGTAISAAVANTDYVPLSAVLIKTADYTITNTDTWIINNKSGSALTLTFPIASAWPGRSVTVKNLQTQSVNSASSNIAPIDSVTAGTAILLPVIGNWATMVSDGTNWVIMQQAPNNILLLE